MSHRDCPVAESINVQIFHNSSDDTQRVNLHSHQQVEAGGQVEATIIEISDEDIARDASASVSDEGICDTDSECDAQDQSGGESDDGDNANCEWLDYANEHGSALRYVPTAIVPPHTAMPLQ